MSDDLDLESIRDTMNWSDTELLLIGYCVVSFERVTFLISGLVEDDHEEQLTLLDKPSRQLAENVKRKFGEGSIGYTTFSSLVDDRNAIIHAFGFPNLEKEKWDRLHFRSNSTVDEKFMKDFIKRCFDFFPILDLKQTLKEIAK